MPSSETILRLMMYVHATAGGIALVVAPLAMAVRKGGAWHRRWGKAFVWAMAVVAITAVIVGWAHENYLLILIAVFSMHMILSGYRALYLKRLHKGQGMELLDKILHGTAGVFNAGLLLWGVMHIIQKDPSPFKWIFTVFGFIGSAFVFRQIMKFYSARQERDAWFFDHFSGMIGGYIATVSAFSAVNLEMLPRTVQWLWPTVIGVPCIFMLVSHYKRKFARGARAHDIAKVKLGR